MSVKIIQQLGEVRAGFHREYHVPVDGLPLVLLLYTRYCRFCTEFKPIYTQIAEANIGIEFFQCDVTGSPLDGFNVLTVPAVFIFLPGYARGFQVEENAAYSLEDQIRSVLQPSQDQLKVSTSKQDIASGCSIRRGSIATPHRSPIATPDGRPLYSRPLQTGSYCHKCTSR